MKKGIRNKQGVYAVHVGDFVYLGSGLLGDRVSGNPSKLRRGVHDNKQLQNAYNEIGEVRVEILDVCKDKKEARESENVWIKHFKMLDDVIVCNKNEAYVSKEYKRKLTKTDVKFIKNMIAKGKRNKDIAEIYDISDSMISRIRNGVRWSSVVI